MKKTGIVLMIAGLIIVLITVLNISFSTEEEVVGIGDYELTREEEHSLDWSPLIGVGVLVVGGIVFLAGRKN